jgi:predicted thioesterase
MTECARYRWEQKEVHAARTAGASRHSVQGRHVAAGAPAMILIMENAALSAIRPFLDIGESAVGTAINVRHLAATPVGHDVRAEAEVTKVDGTRIDFKVSASDEMEEIGNGIMRER